MMRLQHNQTCGPYGIHNVILIENSYLNTPTNLSFNTCFARSLKFAKLLPSNETGRKSDKQISVNSAFSAAAQYLEDLS